MASWDWDVLSGNVRWNDRHYLMQGYAVGEITPSFEAWLARVHPEDRDETVSLIEAARDNRQKYIHEYRTLHPDGSAHWCAARGSFFYNADGQAYRMIRVMEDITERKQREQLQEYLVKLNDAPSPLSDSLEIQRAATRVLGETLHVDRVMYSEIGDNKTTHNILDNYVREGVSKIIGRLPISRFSEYTDRIKGGKAFVVYDMKVDEH